MNKKISEKLSTLPLCPGVYLMKDEGGNIIYVGKSKVLKNRVSQYFQNSANHSLKTLAMVNQIDDFEYVITDTENEALALECNLIKKYLPKYNILLKDDKQYPYIKVTSTEDYPRVFMTRQLKKDKSLYFGPFMSAIDLKDAIEELRKIYKIRSCSKAISGGKANQRPCLYYQINQCSAPCSGNISIKEYRKNLDEMISVLNGNAKSLINDLNKKMNEASEALDFEKAAQLRDKIKSINTFQEKQKVTSSKSNNMDFIAAYRENEYCSIQIFYYRDGKAIGSEYFIFENEQGTLSEVLEGFIKQFYQTSGSLPKTIYLSHEIEDTESISSWLSDFSGHKVTILVPKHGSKLDIMKMVLKNAAESLYKERLLKNRNELYQNRILAELKKLLALEKIPTKIESYDISNISGKSSIGVQIVYQNAVPQKKLYRKYNIKTVDGANDYESMREVLARRINEAYREEDMIKNGELALEKAKFFPLPDLILLDGGRGHVSAIKLLLDTLGEEIPLFGIVKDNSHRTRGITNEKAEYTLDKKSELFKFIACMQDEVHRYAITSHRKKHQKSSVKSELEKIPGVGLANRKKLLAHFKGIKGVKHASYEELKKIVNEKTAQNIIDFFAK